MKCPACGSEESRGDLCSHCLTPLPQSEGTSPPEKPNIERKNTPAPSPLKEGKHRPRPLHDLDLTLPELDVEKLEEAKEGTGAKAAERPGSSPSSKKPSTPRGNPSQPAPETHSPSSVDFNSFILSLGASALMALGETQIPGQSTGAPNPASIDLPQAKEVIDLLGVMKDKTKGNLNPVESQILEQTIYNLRMKYVAASKRK